jgi:hypothetical protein
MEKEKNVENKTLMLIIQPKVIDHLGIKMYQKSVDVISEFVANAWDAESETVEITLQKDTISIVDKGCGMTFNECQKYYLTVGRDRRKETGREVSSEKNRPLLGRKGIGKFAGFGIAETIIIQTISKQTGEKTEFEMDIKSILDHDSRNENTKTIKVVSYLDKDEKRKLNCGTTVTLKGVNIDVSADAIKEFKSELARRFLLPQFYSDFIIKINNEVLPESFSDDMEFVFPRDLTEEEKNKFSHIRNWDDNGWAIESFQGFDIGWRIGFYEAPIQIEELRGVSIFAKGKLAQKPFFFDLAGGISAQNALEYMTGQIRMDFIDEGDKDFISTERQRINLQTQFGKSIREWGIDKIKKLGSIWKKRRSEKRLQELNDKISGFRERLDGLSSSERKIVESVLKKIAAFSRLGEKRFHEWCNDILTSWEIGRLKNLIIEISQTTNLDETRFLEILSEADVLTALNMAESIKTKLYTIAELQRRINSSDLENSVRDFIYNHPWLIHPKWDSYKKERYVEKLINDIAGKELNINAFNGRVDLAMYSGENLLLIEFMRPGISLDRDHLDRINYYVLGVRRGLSKETGGQIKHLEAAYVIADSKNNAEDITDRIYQLSEEKIYVLTWNSLIEQAKKQWEEHLELIKQRNPDDKRIKNL